MRRNIIVAAIWVLGLAGQTLAQDSTGGTGRPEAALADTVAAEAAMADTVAAGAAMADPAATEAATGRGRVTNMPLPRFVSLKGDEGNARRGPSLTNRIDWVFRRRNMPLLITSEFGNWRRVEDQDGQGGWIHYSMLSSARTVVIDTNMAAIRVQPDDKAGVVAEAETGVIARLGDCVPDWCRIKADGERGWVRKADIWGADQNEQRD